MLGYTNVSIILYLFSHFFFNLNFFWEQISNKKFRVDPTDALQYPFIEGFCGDDDEINTYQSLVVHKNGQGGMSRFSLESFMFNDNADAEIYIHCDISLCDSDTEQCEPLCDGSGNFQRRRRRRSAGQNGHGVASVGPFKVAKQVDRR